MPTRRKPRVQRKMEGWAGGWLSGSIFASEERKMDGSLGMKWIWRSVVLGGRGGGESRCM